MSFSEKRKQRIMALRDAGEACYGDLKWWPADGPFEVAVGAILTQNTSWVNVEKAIINLKRAGALSAEVLIKLHYRRLWTLIKPSGFYRAKARAIREISRFFVRGDIEEKLKQPLPVLRKELLAIRGIGEETADSILLYAFKKDIFVVDSYTKRVFARHDICSESASYGRIQSLVHHALDCGEAGYNRFHAHIVEVAKNNCLKKVPKCKGCAFQNTKKTER